MWRLLQWSDRRLHIKGLIVVSFPAAATVMIACGVYFLAIRTVAEDDWVHHSLRVHQEIQRLKAAETEASSVVRAYFVTGDESFAAKSRDAIAAFNVARKRLSELTAHHPAQSERLSRVETIQLAHVERIFGVIARFRSGTLPWEELRPIVRAGENERAEIGRILDAMESEENLLLKARLLRVDTLRRRRGVISVSCLFFGLVGGVVMSILFASGITNRIAKLHANVSRLAAGGALDPLPEGRDEIGMLGGEIAKAASILKHRTVALDNALHGIAEADACGRCLTFNRAYAELTGMPESSSEANVTGNIHPDDKATVEAAIRLMRESGRAEAEARMVHADGKVLDVTMTLIPIPEDEGDGYYVFLRDNRQSKEVQAALVRAKDAAIAANAAKSGFLAKISHDIRTPLNAILGAADLLSESSLNNDQREYVSMFQRNCYRLLRLINDFLDFSRIEAGAVQIQKVPCRIREIVNDAMATFRESAARKKIATGIDIEPGFPEWIVADPAQIERVLVNLLSNAFKFTVEGQVDVSVSGIGAHQRLVRFEVRDTGPGISAEDQARIFAAFSQLPEQNADDRGSGLGLTICRELVDLMGGEIGVVSRKGLGSVFHFDLPLEIASAAGGVPRAPSSVVCQNWCLDEPARLLVAEDTADNRVLIQHYLRTEPVKLRFATNGREAVEISSKSEFDLILMDIDMPEMDGYTATRLIRERQAEQGTVSTPIVALSAHAMREAVRASLDAGCVAHIAKPVDRATLLRTIRRYALSKSVRPVCPQDQCRVADGIASLIPAYLASKPAQIEEARACLALGSFEPIQRLGHNLKGTGRGYGFPRIEELGKEIECAAKAGDEDRIAGQLAALYRFVTEVASARESGDPVARPGP